MPQGLGQGDSLPAVIGPDSILISWLAWLSHIWLQATTSIFLSALDVAILTLNLPLTPASGLTEACVLGSSLDKNPSRQGRGAGI